MARAKPTIYDVAKSSGVSHQTVSRVLNHHPSVRPDTRERVERVMRELGYVPSQAARVLVTARTNLIGILASDTLLFGPAGMVHAIEMEARSFGYVTLTCSIPADSEQGVREGIEHLRRLGIEALIVVTSQGLPHRLARELVTDIPVITVGSGSAGQDLVVGIDNIAGGRAATEYLIALGHRRIVHIAGPMSWDVAADRAAGYAAAMRAAGLDPQVIEGDWSLETGHRIGADPALLGDDVTAVFCCNDHVALGLLKACDERGIEVPGRLSVVGFDDIPEAAFFQPPLTTVRQDFHDLGLRALRMVVDHLGGEGTDVQRLPAPVVVRASTAAPRVTKV